MTHSLPVPASGREINLENNKIASFNWHIFVGPTVTETHFNAMSILQINLKRNPLRCTKQLCWIQQIDTKLKIVQEKCGMVMYCPTNGMKL